MNALREKSILLTGYLEYLVDKELTGRVTILTPRESHRRGCQLSLQFHNCELDQILESLKKAGVICDGRKPSVIRLAPTPLYNTFEDVFDVVILLKQILSH